MNATHPLAHLTAAESALISSIDRATESVNAVGTGLEAALARFHAATLAATDRLQRASAAVRELAGDILVAADAVAREIDEAIVANDPPPPARPEANRLVANSPQAYSQLENGESTPTESEHAEPHAPTVPHWLRGGIVGVIADAADDSHPTAAPQIAEDRAGRDGVNGRPDARPESPDAAGANGTHPPGRNGKTHRRR